MYQSRIRQSKNRDSRKRELIEPDDGQSFAIVQDMLGNGRLRALCADMKVRVARIRGSMRKYSGKVIIERNDLILVAYRDFADETVDVIHKYNQDEVHYMMRHRILPEMIIKKIQIGEMDEIEQNTNDDCLVFMDGDEPDKSDSNDSNEEETDTEKEDTKSKGKIDSESDIDIDAI